MIGQDNMPGQKDSVCEGSEARQWYVQRTVKRLVKDFPINVVGRD